MKLAPLQATEAPGTSTLKKIPCEIEDYVFSETEVRFCRKKRGRKLELKLELAEMNLIS